MKFADDSTIQGFIVDNDESIYKNTIDYFVQWCDEHFLLLNVKKTKEIIFDFRRDSPTHTPLCIKNENVDIVDSYKYLGITISKDLSFSPHIANTCS